MSRNIFKHLHADTPKPEFQFLDLKKPFTSGEGCYVAASATLFAVTLQGGGGPVLIQRHDTPCRIKSDIKKVNTHKGKVLDLQFNPFINNVLATGSEDCTINVTLVDEYPDDMKDNINSADVILSGHQKKVHILKWHPTAMNVLASSSWDKTIMLWDAQTSECVNTYKDLKDNTFSIEWNRNGSLLAATTKDKLMKIFDPRVPDESFAEFECCDGSKSSKVFWAESVGSEGYIGATCFNKMAKRKLRLWDMRMLDKPPIQDEVVDQMTSILMPFFDEDTNLLFTAGKGDGTVSFLSFAGKGYKSCGSYRSAEPQKGGCFVPKRALDTTKCEVARFLKLTKDAVVPLSFCVPRKTGADQFQSDIYPDCFSGFPSMESGEYFKGDNKEKVRMSMDPAKRKDVESVVFEKKKTYAELLDENERLKAQITLLEAQLVAEKAEE